MQVILREEVPNLGTIGDVVKVKPGYARNYLLPRGLAIEASGRNLKEVEHQKRVAADKRLREQKTAAAVADKLGTVVLVLLDEPIKTLGEHKVTIHVGPDTRTTITVSVTPLEE
jgi:ribosomal protein L9